MELKPLSLEDKSIFDSFLGNAPRGLSTYAFPAIYGWKRLFDIQWAIEAGALCVFFTDPTGCFLYLPPLTPAGAVADEPVITACFRVMDGANKHRRVSRIENVEAGDREALSAPGYTAVFKSCDYVYSRKSLVALRGDQFKAKRSVINHFIKNNRFRCLAYEACHRDRCIRIYKEWMAQRSAHNPETVYRGMLSDSLSCLETVLEDFAPLGLEGLVVQVGGTPRGFTLGYRLNQETFCVLFEVADLSVKGCSQFIFRSFCESLAEYRFINAMDDSGLDNLKTVKLSYRPLKLERAYIINHADGDGN